MRQRWTDCFVHMELDPREGLIQGRKDEATVDRLLRRKLLAMTIKLLYNICPSLTCHRDAGPG